MNTTEKNGTGSRSDRAVRPASERSRSDTGSAGSLSPAAGDSKSAGDSNNWLDDLATTITRQLERIDAAELNERAARAAGAATRTARQNPLPLMLIGAGVGWIAYNSAATDKGGTGSRANRLQAAPPKGGAAAVKGVAKGVAERAGELAESAGNKLDDLKESASELADQAKEAIGEASSHALETASEKVEHVYDSTRHAYGQSAATIRQSFRRSPVAYGAGLFATGLLAGLFIPRTRQEDEWFGQASDEVTDSVRDGAQAAARATRERVQAVAQAIEETASIAAGQNHPTSGSPTGGNSPRASRSSSNQKSARSTPKEPKPTRTRARKPKAGAGKSSAAGSETTKASGSNPKKRRSPA